MSDWDFALELNWWWKEPSPPDLDWIDEMFKQVEEPVQMMKHSEIPGNETASSQ